MAEEQPQKRRIPQSELEVYMETTNSLWGKNDIGSPGLMNRLKHFSVVQDKDGNKIYDQSGNPIATEESMWELLGFYTRDMRLANLSAKDGELAYVQYYIDLANDLLQSGHLKPFLIALSRAATRLELSQSKGGFLRKEMNTFTSKNITQDEPPQKTMFGGVKKQKGDY